MSPLAVLLIAIALNVGFLLGVLWNAGAYERGERVGYARAVVERMARAKAGAIRSPRDEEGRA